MNFFPGTYFPMAYFGQEAQEGGQQFASAGAHLVGMGTCTASSQAVASLGASLPGEGGLQGSAALVVSLAAHLSGGSELQGTLSSGQQQQPEPIRSSGGGYPLERREERGPRVFADMAATLSGKGMFSGALALILSVGVTMRGKGSMRAVPVIDITRLLQRRQEEEAMVAVLMAVGY